MSAEGPAILRPSSKYKFTDSKNCSGRPQLQLYWASSPRNTAKWSLTVLMYTYLEYIEKHDYNIANVSHTINVLHEHIAKTFLQTCQNTFHVSPKYVFETNIHAKLACMP